MRRHVLWILVALACALPAACGSDVPAAIDGDVDALAPDGAPDTASVDGDADSVGADATLVDTVQQIPFIPASSFRFEMAGRDGDALLIDVIGRDVPAVFGIALRIEWDPAAAQLLNTSLEKLFGDDTAAVYRSALLRPGSLTLGMAYLGVKKDSARALDGDVKVATLKMKPAASAPFVLSFFGPRCLLVTRYLGKVEATWLSATAYP